MSDPLSPELTVAVEEEFIVLGCNGRHTMVVRLDAAERYAWSIFDAVKAVRMKMKHPVGDQWRDEAKP